MLSASSVVGEETVRADKPELIFFSIRQNVFPYTFFYLRMFETLLGKTALSGGGEGSVCNLNGFKSTN